MRLRWYALALLCVGVCPVGAQDGSAGATPAADALAPAAVVGAPRGTPLAGAALDSEAWRVGSLLRCPVCQGASIVDSPAPTAINMRGQVRALLAAGYTERQILAYFEHSFGAFVRLEPAAQGVNLALWLAPLAALALGAAILFAFLRRSTASVEVASDGSSADAASVPSIPPDDPALKEYLHRVRALTRSGHDAHSKETPKT
jgi:cytochrome c-type biogenesis protein CcmH